MGGLKVHYRSCPVCEATCGLEIKTLGREIVSIRGDEKDPFSMGHICPKAIALKDLYNDPDRLKHPVRRRAGGWEPVSWKEAYDEIEEKIRHIRSQYGRDALSVYMGNPCAHYHGILLFIGFLLRALNTHNRFSASSADQMPLMMACYFMFGHQLLFPVPDVDRTGHFLIVGGNPAVSGGSIMTAPGIGRRLKDIIRRGGQVVVVDPIRTRTAEIAGRHLFIRPGTDIFLMMAMLHTVFRDKLVNMGKMASFCDGIDALRSAVADITPEIAEKYTGIPAGEIIRLAHEFCAADSAVCYGRLGTCVQEYGTLASWLILAFNIVTGKMDRPGGLMFPTPPLDMVGMSAMVNEKGGYNRHRTKVRKLPDVGGEFPVAALAEEILNERDDRIRALICIAGNPVLSSPNGRQLDKALSRLDYMVAIDWYVSETSRHANIILPPTGMLEHAHFPTLGQIAGTRHVAKYSPPVIEPEPGTRHNWQILRELAIRLSDSRAMRMALRVVTPEMILRMGLRFGPHGAGISPWGSGLTLGKVRRARHGLDLGPMRPCLPERLYTKNKRIDLAPGLFLDALARAKREGVGQDRDERFDLLLIGRRHRMSNNSWFHNIERMHTRTNRCTVWIHPDDAAGRGIAAGDVARVESRVGGISLPVEITDRVMRGVVSIPHGWGHLYKDVRLGVATKNPGVSVNDITDNKKLDSLCGNAVFSAVPVSVAGEAGVGN